MHWILVTTLEGIVVPVNLAQARCVVKGRQNDVPCTFVVSPGMAVTVQGQTLDCVIACVETEAEILSMEPLPVGDPRIRALLVKRGLEDKSNPPFVAGHEVTKNKRKRAA